MLILAQLHHDDVVPVIVVSIGGGIAIIAIVLGILRSIVVHASMEKSRREIAAYIAEGSMTPEEGERLLQAGREGNTKC